MENSRGSASLRNSEVPFYCALARTELHRPTPAGLERHSPTCPGRILDLAVPMPTKPIKAAAYELGSPPDFSTVTDSACGRVARRVSIAKL